MDGVVLMYSIICVDGVVLIYSIICVMCGRCGVNIQNYMCDVWKVWC